MEKAQITERYGRMEELDRSFDIAYWQAQGGNAIFRAAWDRVIDAYRLRNETSDERLRRDIEVFGKLPRPED